MVNTNTKPHNSLSSKKLLTILAMLFLFFTLFTFLTFTTQNVLADKINVTSGHIYSAVLHTSISSDSWAGVKVIHDSTTLTESYSPFLAANLGTNTIIQSTFPGVNLNDGSHYYLASILSTYDPNNLENISASDLEENKIFNETNFDVFYPDYNGTRDNPENTFCCTTKTIQLNGKTITVFDIIIGQNIHYYLGKYNDSGNGVPLFISPIQNETCYNGTSCVSEFLLPKNSNPYYFYALNSSATTPTTTTNHSHHRRRNTTNETTTNNNNDELFSLNLTVHRIVETEQGKPVSILFKVGNDGDIPSTEYIVGPVVPRQWEFSYRKVSITLYPGNERIGNFLIEPRPTTEPGDYDVLVTLYDPQHNFIKKKHFALRVLPRTEPYLNLDVHNNTINDTLETGNPIPVGFFVTNPTTNDLSGIIARSNDPCVRRITGEHDLKAGESQWFNYDFTFNTLPCDATIEFYSRNTLIGFTEFHTGKNGPERERPQFLLRWSSLFRIFLLIIWLILLILAFKKDKCRRKQQEE